MTAKEAELMIYVIPITCWVIFGIKIYYSTIDKISVNKARGKELTPYKFTLLTLICGPLAWCMALAMLLGSILTDIEPKVQKLTERIDNFLFTTKKDK